MMNQIISKSLTIRLSLMFFIFLCSVFISENAYSIAWDKVFKEVTPNKKEETIDIKIVVYDYDLNPTRFYGFLSDLDLQYSENGTVFKPLLKTHLDFSGPADQVSAKIFFMKQNERIDFPDCTTFTKNSYKWVTMKAEKMVIPYQNRNIFRMSALITIKWHLPKSIKTVKTIKMKGTWGQVSDNTPHHASFNENASVDFVRPEKDPKESNNKLKAIGMADVISVTGVNSGENIKVYNAVTNVEVKSVIAHDNVVNIMLPKGKVYLIKVGSNSVKVAL